MVGEGPMAQGRKRIEKHKASFEERLEQEAIKFKEAAIIIKNKEHLTEKGLNKVIDLKKSMNKND